MNVVTTAIASAGSVNIVLPVLLRKGDRLRAVAAGNLTTANQLIAIYLAPARLASVSSGAEEPSDILSECTCLRVRSQTALGDRITWSGEALLDHDVRAVLAVFYNCSASDRVQLAVNFEGDHAK